MASKNFWTISELTMSEVEILINAKNNSVSTIYMRFVLLSGNNNKEALYYFIEGYDAPYYDHRVNLFCKGESIPIKCNGKSNVISIRNLLKSKQEYKDHKIGFFVDKDFDNNLGIGENIYITPCYSIENFYTNTETLANILKCEFDILPSERVHTQILDLFKQQQSSFHNAVLEFNAWYFCIKNHEVRISVNLEDNFPREFINLEIGNIQKKYSIETIKEKYPCCPEISGIDLNKAILSFGNFETALRGKYEMQFFCSFLTFLIDDANSVKKRKYIKKKTKFQINKSLILSQLSQYARTPADLEAYILKIAA